MRRPRGVLNISTSLRCISRDFFLTWKRTKTTDNGFQPLVGMVYSLKIWEALYTQERIFIRHGLDIFHCRDIQEGPRPSPTTYECFFHINDSDCHEMEQTHSTMNVFTKCDKAFESIWSMRKRNFDNIHNMTWQSFTLPKYVCLYYSNHLIWMIHQKGLFLGVE